MFRIKTALLACLLLVAVASSVSALGETKDSQLASFGQFLADHQSSKDSELLQELTSLTNTCIRIAPNPNFAFTDRFVSILQTKVQSSLGRIMGWAEVKNYQLDPTQLLQNLKDIRSALVARNSRSALSLLNEIRDLLRDINPVQ